MDIKTVDNTALLTLRVAHKEHEGVYTARLRTWDKIQEHSAFVYIKGRNVTVIKNCAHCVLQQNV